MNACTFAGLEIRTLVRLSRTWLTVSAIVAVGLIVYWTQALEPDSPVSIDPRFLVSVVGGIALGVACLGIVFLSLDVRAQDEHHQIADSLDSRPYSNFDLVVGRSIGVSIVAWTALAGTVAVIEVVDVLIQEPPSASVVGMEPVSLAAFLLVSAPAKVVFWSALVTFLATAIRTRILVALAAIGLLCLTYVLLFRTPYYLLSPVFGAMHFGHSASDLLPEFVNGTDLLHVMSLAVGSLSLFVLAAAAHPRLDLASIRPRLFVGAGLALASAAGIVFLMNHAIDHVRYRSSWITALDALGDLPNVDIERLEGRVSIIPDSHLTIDVDLRVRVSGDSTNLIAFALNPGLVVQEVRVDDSHAPHHHVAGLLEIDLEQQPTPEDDLEVSIKAMGIPDVDFGYLDSAVDFRMKSLAASELHLLGTRNSIFDARYVALMPAISWLPTPISGVHGRNRRHQDYFAIDLVVSAPPEWTVVGPGRREPIVGGNGLATHRFRPAEVWSNVVVVAAPFVRHSRRFGDFEVELLAHPKHADSLLRYSDVVDEYAFNIELALSALSRYGISPTAGGLSLVEIPGALRVYGGGMEMAQVQSFAGITFLREFDLPIRGQDEPNTIDNVQLRSYQLMSYIDANRAGGNVAYGSATSLLRFQIPEWHAEAHLVQLVIHDIVNEIVKTWASLRREPRRFSAHLFVHNGGRLPRFLRDPADTVGKIIGLPPRSSSRSSAAWNLLARDPTLTSDMDDCPDDVLDAMYLKSRIAASLIVDSIGLDEAGKLIGGMVQRRTGEVLTWQSLVASLSDVRGDVQLSLDDWMSRTAIPAFSASKASVFRLADADGKPRYQTSVHVRNDSSTSGFARLQVIPQRFDLMAPTTTAPVPVKGGNAVEIGLVYPYPIESAMIVPYLSHNHGPIRLQTPEFAHEEQVPKRALEGHRESDWEPMWRQWIVVDDLDAGFKVVDGEVKRPRSPCSLMDHDAGLPSYGSGRMALGDWSRQVVSSAWGRHRKTIARSFGEDGSGRVAFSAHLPDADVWRLEYHLPDPNWREGAWEERLEAAQSYGMELVFENGRQFEIDFSVSEADPGWNRLGDFDVQGGKAILTVGNRTIDGVVVADAIRWRRAN